jgi:DNA repair protein RecN (Recombination protein N)
MVEAVNGHLRDLSLGQACFSVTYDWASWPSTFPHQGGLAEPCIQFQWQPNPGEPPRPLIKIASGGELSRLMLALLIVGAKDRQKTLFFDEIDTGVGGETAIPLGKKLADLAVFQQVWCITHLAQVAQFAHQHVLVVKEVVQDRTFTTLSPLDAAARQQELARLLGGDTKSEALLQHAKAMLNQSQGGQV